MAYYTRKPELVEAIQWTGDNIQEIFEFCRKDADLLVEVLQEASINDYVIISYSEEPEMTEVYTLPNNAFHEKFQPDSCILDGSGCE